MRENGQFSQVYWILFDNSKFENLSRSAALTQFVKFISDETPQNHSINTPKHPKALENYAITHQKIFLTS